MLVFKRNPVQISAWLLAKYTRSK